VLAMRARRRAMAISASRAGMITVNDYANAVCALRCVVVVACALDSEAHAIVVVPGTCLTDLCL